jgi:hypothetical protein
VADEDKAVNGSAPKETEKGLQSRPHEGQEKLAHKEHNVPKQESAKSKQVNPPADSID